MDICRLSRQGRGCCYNSRKQQDAKTFYAFSSLFWLLHVQGDGSRMLDATTGSGHGNGVVLRLLRKEAIAATAAAQARKRCSAPDDQDSQKQQTLQTL
jgi:hypothetical protein